MYPLHWSPANIKLNYLIYIQSFSYLPERSSQFSTARYLVTFLEVITVSIYSRLQLLNYRSMKGMRVEQINLHWVKTWMAARARELWLCLYLFTFKSVIRVSCNCVCVWDGGPQSQYIGIISLSNNSIRAKPMAPSHLSKTHYWSFVRVIAAIILRKTHETRKICTFVQTGHLIYRLAGTQCQLSRHN